jgi:drug/metabolite transporter (DMT)-like permease
VSRFQLPGISCRWRVIAAFAAVYLIWGATYLFIRFAIETLPPFLMAGTRFLIAGSVLYGVAWLNGASRPTRAQWGAAALVGGLLLLGGNGGVVWAEQSVPSGLAALLVAMAPLWMAVLDWVRPGGVRPSKGVALGLGLGFAGVILLVGPDELVGGGRVDPIGAAVLILASLSWAAGSVYSRHGQRPASPLLGTGMQMLAGGVFLLLAGSAAGEWVGFDYRAVSLRSLASLGFLIAFGSLVGFTAYIWLLRVTTVARASTYAYVNPAVAVFLGWALAGEALTLRTMLAAGVIVAAVVVITTHQARQAASAKPGAAAKASKDLEPIPCGGDSLAAHAAE